MLSRLVLVFILLSTRLFSVFLLTSTDDVEKNLLVRAYREILLPCEYDKHIFSEEEINIQLCGVDSRLQTVWVPNALFQLFVLERYFHDEDLQALTKQLGYGLGYRDRSDDNECLAYTAYHQQTGNITINVDDDVIAIMAESAKSLHDIHQLYSTINTNPEFIELFFKLNKEFILRDRPGLPLELITHIPTEFTSWKKVKFSLYS